MKIFITEDDYREAKNKEELYRSRGIDTSKGYRMYREAGQPGIFVEQRQVKKTKKATKTKATPKKVTKNATAKADKRKTSRSSK